MDLKIIHLGWVRNVVRELIGHRLLSCSRPELSPTTAESDGLSLACSFRLHATQSWSSFRKTPLQVGGEVPSRFSVAETLCLRPAELAEGFCRPSPSPGFGRDTATMTAHVQAKPEDRSADPEWMEKCMQFCAMADLMQNPPSSFSARGAYEDESTLFFCHRAACLAPRLVSRNRVAADYRCLAESSVLRSDEWYLGCRWMRSQHGLSQNAAGKYATASCEVGTSLHFAVLIMDARC